MDKDLIQQIDLLNAKQNKQICIIRDGLICLKYGEAEYRFNPNGFSLLYNMHRLYNNDVVNAILR